MQLVRKIAENYKLPYYTLSPTYSVCAEHGYLSGEQSKCPVCGKTTEVYSRITGYYRPIQNWNDGKVQEYKDRKEYTVLTRDFKKIENEEKGEKCDSCSVQNSTQDILFATTTCPNCKLISSLLDNK